MADIHEPENLDIFLKCTIFAAKQKCIVLLKYGPDR